MEGNAFKRKQMEHLRSQLMTGMDAEIGIIPLCILMGNICLSAWSGRTGAFREIVFFHLQDSKDLLGFLRKPMSPSWWSLKGAEQCKVTVLVTARGYSQIASCSGADRALSTPQ